MKHSVLLRQLKKNKVEVDSLSPNLVSLLETIDKFYHTQDEDKSRISHLVNTVTHENDILIDNLKKQSEIAIRDSKMSVLGEMSAGIAHEINNPLMVLQSIVSLLEDEIISDEVNKESLLGQIQEAEKTIERISKIVNGLKTFSRDGKKDPLIECNVCSIIDDTLSLCQEKINKDKIKLTNNIDKNLKIKGRPSELSQVFLNLILNFRDAISPSSEKWITLDSQEDSEKIVLTVTDSGKGIPLEIQDKLMNPFFTTKPIGKGTGLGLSISKGIIESHMGSLTIDNECSNTRFKIIIKKTG